MVLFRRRTTTRKPTWKKVSRRRTYKRKSYGRKRMTHMRKKRRFPTTGPTTKLTRIPLHREDRIRIKLKSQLQCIVVPTPVVGVDPAIGTTWAVGFACNSITSTVGTPIFAGKQVTAGTTSAAYSWPQPQGMQELYATYLNSQVRACKMYFTITLDEQVTFSPQPSPFLGCVLPIPGYQWTTMTATLATFPFYRICQQPKAKVFKLWRTADDISAGLGGTYKVSIFDSPSKILSLPMYYSNATTWSAYNADVGDIMYYAIFICYPPGSFPTGGSAPTFTINAFTHWSVEFFTRGTLPMSCPMPPLQDIVGEVEEKDLDEVDDFKMLTVTEPVTPSRAPTVILAEESKEEKKSTCLNAAHPATAHSRVGTCV